MQTRSALVKLVSGDDKPGVWSEVILLLQQDYLFNKPKIKRVPSSEFNAISEWAHGSVGKAIGKNEFLYMLWCKSLQARSLMVINCILDTKNLSKFWLVINCTSVKKRECTVCK